MELHTVGGKFAMADRIHGGGGNLDSRKCKSGLPRDAGRLWAKRWALTTAAFQLWLVSCRWQRENLLLQSPRHGLSASDPLVQPAGSS